MATETRSHQHYSGVIPQTPDGTFVFPWLRRPLTPEEVVAIRHNPMFESCVIKSDGITQAVTMHPDLPGLVTWCVGRHAKDHPELSGSACSKEEAVDCVGLARAVIHFIRDECHQDADAPQEIFDQMYAEFKSQGSQTNQFGAVQHGLTQDLPLN